MSDKYGKRHERLGKKAQKLDNKSMDPNKPVSDEKFNKLQDRRDKVVEKRKKIRAKKDSPAKKTISEIREEPGMSNAGKYKDVAKEDFCGPKGTYPVNTLERAKSALKLAHNAGSKRKIKKIKDCVLAKYPELNKDKES